MYAVSSDVKRQLRHNAVPGMDVKNGTLLDEYWVE